MSQTFPLRPSSGRRRNGDHRATTPSPLRHSSTVPTTPPEERKASYTSPIQPPASHRRVSLRTLPQAPNFMPATPTLKPAPEARHPISIGLSRSSSRRAPTHDHGGPLLESADLAKLGQSTTEQLRTLSKLADHSDKKDFSISSLQRNLTERVKKTSSVPGYGGRTRMDTERQYRQAYEYLCHIGEAKEWIEHIISKPIPAIVQLEEALRDGVTLAELVQSLRPDRRLRLFRNPRLQYRHSDNIVIFFNFLAEVELPELFRFELVDLYEKKNIPKVIYCIHALSWLLIGRGMVDFRIGNLVGQLKFEHHELETTQKGLEKAGVSMPNFSGMGEKFGAEPEPAPDPEPEPEPEPVETEEDRIARELGESVVSIERFQTEARGALLRIRLAEDLHALYEQEIHLTDLQSKIRGVMARQTSLYQLERHHFAVELQRNIRGFLIRSSAKAQQLYWKSHERQVVVVQSLVRARNATRQVQGRRLQLQRHWNTHISEIILLQSLVRKMAASRVVETARADRRAYWKKHEGKVTLVQNLTRRRAAIKTLQNLKSERRMYWEEHEREVILVQSLTRKRAAMKLSSALRSERAVYWRQQEPKVVVVQSLVRRRVAAKATQLFRSSLKLHNFDFAQIQASARGAVLRRGFCEDLDRLQEADPSIISIQSRIRSLQMRKQLQAEREELERHKLSVVDLQSQLRAMLLRSKVAHQLESLEDETHSTIRFQAIVRGKLVRAKFVEKQRFFNENMQKVIKLQSFVRMKQQGEAYKSLTNGKNPPVSTIKNFVHLLNDSDFDFDQEIESEKLQQELVRKIQDIERVEDFISEIDAKIGLLAHTKIASDEVAKLKRQFNTHSAGLSRKGTLLKEPFGSAALNKVSRAKLERYQELFFILQTQPQYLARFFRSLRDHGTSEAEYKKFESLIISTFALVQKAREEFFLLKLLSRSIKEEIDGCATIQEFTRGKFFFARLFTVYARAPKDREYLNKHSLGPFIKTQVLENEQLNLESDPLLIYRSLIDDEELRTGKRSHRDPGLAREEAIRQDDVRKMFVNHLQDIRDLIDYFLPFLKETVQHMPYGRRYVAQQMLEMLQISFPLEDPQYLLQVVGNWLWKIYFKPALADPEGYGLVDRGIDQIHKRNIAELSRVMSQVATGRMFDDENVYLQPLNRYLQEYAMGALEDVWLMMVNIPPPELYFDIGQLDDFKAKTKPSLYIKLADIFAVHHLVEKRLPSICITQEDTILREVLRDLGSAKSNEAEMSGGPAEVTLSLGGRIHAIEDPDAKTKATLIETKRCVLYIIRVQTGASLLEILVKTITQEDCDRWDVLVAEELSIGGRKRNAYADHTNNLIDIASLTFAELKRTALENVIALEQQGKLSRHNQYQDLLNDIAVDIRTKHRRRIQRQKELETIRTTSRHLKEKQAYLDDKLKAYNDTFEQSVAMLQEKSARAKKFVVPFSKQWTHERELAKTGRTPQYGSWRRSAEHFASRGVLLSWEGRDWRLDDLTVSSDKVNEFIIEGSRGALLIPGAVATFTWDDLLTADYEGRDVLEFFSNQGAGGVLRVDRRALMLWLSKKFLASA